MKQKIIALILCIATVFCLASAVTVNAETVKQYDSLEEAAAYAREQFVNRNPEFEIRIKKEAFFKSSSIINDSINEAAEYIFDYVFAHTGVPTEGDYLLWQFGRYGWSARYDGKVLYLDTEASYYTTKDEEAIVTRLVGDILDTLDLDGKTDYEKVLAIYDYICSHVTYSTGDLSIIKKHTCYYALTQGNAVCQGYALLFYRLCLECGIDARIVSGSDPDGEGHGWNIVKLGGKYYFADTTWDTAGKHKYFLCGMNDFAEHDDYTVDRFLLDYNIADTRYVPNAHAVCGDFNDDGEVTTKDAIYLLYYTFFPDEYPIRQSGDIDANGYVDSEDAVYLVYHVFFPEEFPIEVSEE